MNSSLAHTTWNNVVQTDRANRQNMINFRKHTESDKLESAVFSDKVLQASCQSWTFLYFLFVYSLYIKEKKKKNKIV